ncbi:MAG: SGNH/GDSL hydrolase family protein [Terriglobia bacterium]|jgi:lysophospholipase L1-like esterase
MNNVKKIIVGLCLSLCLPFSVRAQFVQDFNPPPAPCCLRWAAALLADQLQDWNQLGRYHQDNLRLESSPAVEGRVVFLGDSITDGWPLAKYFPGKPYVNRGISGQTTMQMLVRMYPDVVHLHPAAFILLAGTNDIARNTGPETLAMVEDNIRAMCELAGSHNIKIILCLLTPVSDYTKAKQTDRRPPADIVNLNHWIESYARDVHAQVADYYTALVDDKGMLREGYSDDGLHPNARGYELLAPVAEAAIEGALK